MPNFFEKRFQLSGNGVTIRGEIAAGLTTFLTMAYIIVVNPAILSAAGMPADEVFFATCLSSALATALMGLWAKYPFALAPGMGLNAFFAYVVCGTYHVPWPQALATVLLSGLLFLVLSAFGVREKILAAIPSTISRAAAAGIGLFIAFIGLQNAGIVIASPATLVRMGDLHQPATLVAAAGIVITSGLAAARIRGAILIGILATTLLAMTFGVAPPPEAILSVPTLPRTTLGAALTALPGIFTASMAAIVFTFLFLDLFDTVGTLLALGTAVNAIGPDNRMPRADRAFVSDAGGTILGALLGTSTVTSYIESAAGVASGGRTGLVSVVVAALFVLALPFAPLAVAIPQLATAPALIVVGAFMMRIAKDIAWDDPVEAIPALGILLVMPATYNISNGLGAGFILYVITHIADRRWDKLNRLLVLIAVLFLLYFIFIPAA